MCISSVQNNYELLKVSGVFFIFVHFFRFNDMLINIGLQTLQRNVQFVFIYSAPFVCVCLCLDMQLFCVRVISEKNVLTRNSLKYEQIFKKTVSWV